MTGYLTGILIITASLGLGIYFITRKHLRKGIPTNKEEISALMLKNFEGLYEVLYKASNENLPKKVMIRIIKDWDLRIGKFGNEYLKNKWKVFINDNFYQNSVDSLESVQNIELNSALRIWCDSIMQMGAYRDERGSFQIDGSSSQYYIFEEAYKIGDYAKIEIPCWKYKDTGIILQRGSASIVLPE